MAVSAMGRPSTMTGTAMATTVVFFTSAPSSDVAASTKPRNMLPESPMKMLAGLKLNTKKPTIAPASVAESSMTM